MKKLIWLRHETKPFEERSVLTPRTCQTLIDKGFDVVVEKSEVRAFKDEEFEKLGLTLVPSNSWQTMAPKHAIILGLKELEKNDFPLSHQHIHFAHCYKGQNGSAQFLSRFRDGGGTLFDLEFLTNEKGCRIAAFGIWAGFAGALLAMKTWVAKKKNIDINKKMLQSYPSAETSVEETVLELTGIPTPKILIIGANGRCGKGAQKFLKELNINPTCWGSKETKGKGPIKEILDYNILINCALMMNKTPPFLTKDILSLNKNLSIISDVGCDPTGPFNPLPIYQNCTTMDRPVCTLNSSPEISITAIDHLPSLFPRESSEDFSSAFLPHFIDFLDSDICSIPFNNAHNLFIEKMNSYFPSLLAKIERPRLESIHE